MSLSISIFILALIFVLTYDKRSNTCFNMYTSTRMGSSSGIQIMRSGPRGATSGFLAFVGTAGTMSPPAAAGTTPPPMTGSSGCCSPGAGQLGRQPNEPLHALATTAPTLCIALPPGFLGPLLHGLAYCNICLCVFIVATYIWTHTNEKLIWYQSLTNYS